MNKEELNEIITKLESSNSESKGYFSISVYGGGMDEITTEANERGLELLAVQLLKAAIEMKDTYVDGLEMHSKEEDFIYLYIEDFWYEGDIFINDIKPIKEEIKHNIDKSYKETLSDKLWGIFLAGVLIFVFISILIGAFTILKWLLSIVY